MITGLCLTVFMALLALVLDIGHLAAVRGELQNAADAGALAGARALLPPGNLQKTNWGALEVLGVPGFGGPTLWGLVMT